MANKNANTNKKLAKAKAAKYDEFFTRRQDIEAELRSYRDKFRGKTVYSNCDDPRESEFVHHFCRNLAYYLPDGTPKEAFSRTVVRLRNPLPRRDV